MMAMRGDSAGEGTGGTKPYVPTAPSVYLVTHDDQASSVTVSGGGTIAVDLVVENTETLPDFFGLLAVSAKSVAYLDGAGWTDEDNVRTSNAGHRVPALQNSTGETPVPQLISYYNAEPMDWYVVLDYDADQIGDDSIRSLSYLDDSRKIATGLVAANLDDLTGWINVPHGSWYVTRSPVGAIYHTHSVLNPRAFGAC